MSADLSAAVEAMARAAHDGCGCLDEPIQQWILDDARRDLTAALPFIREQIAAEIEAEATRLAAKRDEHRAIAITRRGEGNGRAHDAHLKTALSFRSEATGMWDAAAIARGGTR